MTDQALHTPVILPNGRSQMPTDRQVAIVKQIGEYRRKGIPVAKATILRDVGYSEHTIDKPSQVFGSPTLIALMDKTGLAESDLAEGHKYLMNAKRPEHLTFPPFRAKGEGAEEVEGEDNSEQIRGEQMTDAEIREYIHSIGGDVFRIVHGDMARHVYIRVRDTKALEAALDMGYNLRGSYAPKKVEGKHSHAVGVFSMKGLRQKMQKAGMEVIQHEQ